MWHTPLARNYDFFYYDLTKALFLSDQEQTIINTLVETYAFRLSFYNQLDIKIRQRALPGAIRKFIGLTRSLLNTTL